MVPSSPTAGFSSGAKYNHKRCKNEINKAILDQANGCNELLGGAIREQWQTSFHFTPLPAPHHRNA